MAVTERSSSQALPGIAGALLMVLLPAIGSTGVLPEDRADTLYHLYDGGGVKIDGPSVLVRKGFANKVSVAGQYYVDTISGASVDVVSTASPYTEERTETGVGPPAPTSMPAASWARTPRAAPSPPDRSTDRPPAPSSG